MNLLIALLSIVAGYLIGSISFARLVAGRFAPEQDISKVELEVPDSDSTFESDAVSASSVRLNLGTRYGCLTGALDILKGTLPSLAFKLWQPEEPYYLLAAGMAAVGHIWPVYYRFKGGRGMSPIVGGMLVVDWLGVLVTNLLGLFSDFIIRSTLVSSAVWLVLMIPWVWVRGGEWPEVIYAVSMCVLFLGAMIPEWREIWRLNQAGELDKLQEAREVRVLSRLDQGTALQQSWAGAISDLLAKLRRKNLES